MTTIMRVIKPELYDRLITIYKAQHEDKSIPPLEESILPGGGNIVQEETIIPANSTKNTTQTEPAGAVEAENNNQHSSIACFDHTVQPSAEWDTFVTASPLRRNTHIKKLQSKSRMNKLKTRKR